MVTRHIIAQLCPKMDIDRHITSGVNIYIYSGYMHLPSLHFVPFTSSVETSFVSSDRRTSKLDCVEGEVSFSFFSMILKRPPGCPTRSNGDRVTGCTAASNEVIWMKAL